eukprot:CAMPEP_0202866390 /NCGR_PEP_ID=MMETSP1391-20130828/7421_1 /ASSEMBLY_ACC=CAM_ASM_000867 /TAXON_ID=1034604 /ORGANISM="Chlamydomonas leiostraca, Strain SAG 11-49" /LENGTH=109 /DNA_ID=CAMNT_0049546329 /DNA_START=144 /DNA_END=471 /DNA_ORIENTATION=-
MTAAPNTMQEGSLSATALAVMFHTLSSHTLLSQVNPQSISQDCRQSVKPIRPPPTPPMSRIWHCAQLTQAASTASESPDFHAPQQDGRTALQLLAQADGHACTSCVKSW